MSGIFISYRREDTAGYAGRLFDSIRRIYGDDSVFLDVGDDKIRVANQWKVVLQEKIQSSSALFAVIGKTWLSTLDAEGKRRIDDPDDPLRNEITSALAKPVPVVPILVNNAGMPNEEDLPEALKPLLDWQGKTLHDSGWDDEVKQLCKQLEEEKILPSKAPKYTLDEDVARALLKERQNGNIPFSMCDRVVQWADLEIMSQNNKHMAIFLPGEINQAHLFFLERIRRHLTDTPKRIIHTVAWSEYPQSRKEFIEAIGAAFGCDSEEALVKELQRLLLEQNIYLLHSPVVKKNHLPLIDYYCEWLPDLINLINPQSNFKSKMGTIKSIQPIGWVDAASQFILSKDSFDNLMAQIKQRIRAQTLSMKVLDELSNITKTDVEKWAVLMEKQNPAEFAEEITLGTRSTAEIVQRIANQ